MSSRILLVEDEPGLSLTVSDLLAAEGYLVDTAADGPTGLAQGADPKLDLMILDVMLPGMNGVDVCAGLRKQGCDTAILMLTAKTRVPDRVAGLKVGADDYLAKPFDPAELLARVEALLRRVTKKGRAGVARFEFNSVEADFERGQVRKNGDPVSMAAKEIQLLRYLIDHRDTVVTREELLRQVWEYRADISSRTIDVHVAWLRQKLEDNPQSPKYIQTVRGVGYRFSN
jgi:two-component system, OmpR family, alkaline phosphatase synthesis response regulator PhoP